MSALVRETVKRNHTPTAVQVHASVNVLKKSNNSITDHHSDMLNLTSRIAVKMQNLPDWDVDWNDSRPQRPRSSLTCSDILPDDDDATELLKRAVMEFLVSEFNSLKDLKPYVPPRQSPHPVRRTIVAPMEILFKDEKHKSETIDILTELMKDAALTGQPQVNIHSCSYHIYTCTCVYV